MIQNCNCVTTTTIIIIVKLYYECIALSYYDNAMDNPVYGMNTCNKRSKTSDQNKDATGDDDYHGLYSSH